MLRRQSIGAFGVQVSEFQARSAGVDVGVALRGGNGDEAGRASRWCWRWVSRSSQSSMSSEGGGGGRRRRGWWAVSHAVLDVVVCTDE
jgi:hypothetical protein